MLDTIVKRHGVIHMTSPHFELIFIGIRMRQRNRILTLKLGTRRNLIAAPLLSLIDLSLGRLTLISVTSEWRVQSFGITRYAVTSSSGKLHG